MYFGKYVKVIKLCFKLTASTQDIRNINNVVSTENLRKYEQRINLQLGHKKVIQFTDKPKK